MKELLIRAAEIIDREATSIRECHTMVNGDWDIGIESDRKAKDDYGEMIVVRDKLLEMASKDIELIEWHPVSEVPKEMTTVLVCSEEAGVETGYIDEGTWICDAAYHEISGVTKWANMPSGTSGEGK